MDKVQFIAAKDLPVAESKDVNALCVENGELKQTPMSGGAGGYMIRLKQEWLTEYTEDQMTFQTDICYDEIAELVYNGGSVWVDMSALQGAFTVFAPVGISRMDDENYTLLVAMFGTPMIIYVNMPAGTWQPPVE